MLDMISDVVKHTGGLGFINIVKIVGSKKETKIEAIDDKKSVVVKGKAKAPVAEFDGEFGMTNLGLIKGLVDHPNFKNESAKVEVIRQPNPKNDAETIPSEVVFTDAEGQSASYRFMNADMVPSQAKFLGAKWDVVITPSKSKIAEFTSFANLYSAFETEFMVDTLNGDLRFHIGDPHSASHRATLVFEKGVTGNISGNLHWPTAQVLAILKLADQSLEMKFASAGALMITMQTDMVDWDYILPARKK